MSFLKTLGKHVLPPDKLEPAPLAGDAPVPPVVSPAPDAPPAGDTPPAPVDNTPPAGDAPALEPKKRKKSEPLPAPAAEDFTPAPAALEAPKEIAALLGYEAGEAEKDYLEVLREAAEREPEYQAVFDREVSRLKKVNDYVTKWQQDNPDDEFDPSSMEYRRFLKTNPPAIDATAHRKLERSMIEARASARTRKEVIDQLTPELRRVRVLELKPELEATRSAVEAALLDVLPADDYLRQAAKGGIDKVAEVPIEGEHMLTHVRRAQQTVAEFLELRRGIKDFDIKNEFHVYIGQTVHVAAKIFAEQGGAERTREGKTFIAPADFQKLTPAAQGRHWTFTDDDVIQIFTQSAAASLKETLTETRTKLDANAERRKPKPPAGEPKPEAKPAPKPPTPSSPTLSPTPAANGEKPSGQNGPKNPRLHKLMGLG